MRATIFLVVFCGVILCSDAVNLRREYSTISKRDQVIQSVQRIADSLKLDNCTVADDNLMEVLERSEIKAKADIAAKKKGAESQLLALSQSFNRTQALLLARRDEKIAAANSAYGTVDTGCNTEEAKFMTKQSNAVAAESAAAAAEDAADTAKNDAVQASQAADNHHQSQLQAYTRTQEENRNALQRENATAQSTFNTAVASLNDNLNQVVIPNLQRVRNSSKAQCQADFDEEATLLSGEYKLITELQAMDKALQECVAQGKANAKANAVMQAAIGTGRRRLLAATPECEQTKRHFESLKLKARAIGSQPVLALLEMHDETQAPDRVVLYMSSLVQRVEGMLSVARNKHSACNVKADSAFESGKQTEIDNTAAQVVAARDIWSQTIANVTQEHAASEAAALARASQAGETAATKQAAAAAAVSDLSSKQRAHEAARVSLASANKALQAQRTHCTNARATARTARDAAINAAKASYTSAIAADQAFIDAEKVQVRQSRDEAVRILEEQITLIGTIRTTADGLRLARFTTAAPAVTTTTTKAPPPSADDSQYCKNSSPYAKLFGYATVCSAGQCTAGWEKATTQDKKEAWSLQLRDAIAKWLGADADNTTSSKNWIIGFPPTKPNTVAFSLPHITCEKAHGYAQVIQTMMMQSFSLVLSTYTLEQESIGDRFLVNVENSTAPAGPVADWTQFGTYTGGDLITTTTTTTAGPVAAPTSPAPVGATGMTGATGATGATGIEDSPAAAQKPPYVKGEACKARSFDTMLQNIVLLKNDNRADDAARAAKKACYTEKNAYCWSNGNNGYGPSFAAKARITVPCILAVLKLDANSSSVKGYELETLGTLSEYIDSPTTSCSEAAGACNGCETSNGKQYDESSIGFGKAAWDKYKAEHDKTACNGTLSVTWQTLIDSVNSTAGDYVTSLSWKQIPLIDPASPEATWSAGGVLRPTQLGQLLGDWGNCTDKVSIEPVSKATVVSDAYCAAQSVTKSTFDKVFGTVSSLFFL